MFQIGLNTNVYIDYPIDKVIRKAYLMGYEGVEIARTHLQEPNESDVSLVRELVTKYGLSIYGVQGGVPYTDREFGTKRIELARKLDCPVVNLGPGIAYRRSDNPKKAWETSLEVLRELNDYARRYGITGAIEPEVRVLLSPLLPTIDRYELYEDVRRVLPDLGLVLDVEHALVAYENPDAVIKKYKNLLKIIHVSDTLDHLHLHLIPGRGEIDFKNLFTVLEEVGYENFISVEIPPYFNSPDEAAFKSITYLRKVLREL